MITTYTDQAAPREKYLNLVKKLYSKQPKFRTFFADLNRQFNPQSPTARKQKRFCIAIENKGEFVAHVVLMVDPREKTGVGWFGFFECNKNKKTFNQLWLALVKISKELNIKTLCGPINGCIWYQYRFISNGHNSVLPFIGELICQAHYHDLFKSIATKKFHYYSAIRKDFRKIITITEPCYIQAKTEKITFKKQKSLNLKLINSIFKLVKKVFISSWRYIPLTSEELQYFYSKTKHRALDTVYTMHKNNRLIGFALCFLEEKRVLNIKTLAIDTNYQGKGLGKAFINFIHKDVTSRCDRLIYALIRSKNKVSRLPDNEARIIRQYCAYEIQIS